MGDDDKDRRIGKLEDDVESLSDQMGELVVVVMGPAPNHDNGIRGDLKALKAAFYSHKEEGLKGGIDVTTAQITMKGVVLAASIPAGVSALVSIILALLT